MQIITIDSKTPKEIQQILKETEIEALNFIDNKSRNENLLETALLNIKNIFGLKNLPLVINAFDNTNFSGHFSTGVCIVWENGEFIKKDYRKYNFKELQNGSDDFTMMKEMLSRRIKEIISKNIKVDLFLIDGGKMQRTAIMQVLNEINFFHQEFTNEFEVDFICIAKGEHRNSRNETFFTKELNDIKLDIYREEIKFLQKLRDEAHRFASVNLRLKADKNFIK